MFVGALSLYLSNVCVVFMLGVGPILDTFALGPLIGLVNVRGLGICIVFGSLLLLLGFGYSENPILRLRSL